MVEDARFEDAAERPLALIAQAAEDVTVMSALLQDAVFPVTEMRFERKARRFSLLLNRFRWEEGDRPRGRSFERVRTVLSIGDVTHVASQGIDRTDKDVILSLLSLEWQPGTDGTGRIVLTLAGDGAIAVDVECIDLALKDVTRPYAAPSGHKPQHPE